MPKLYIMCGLAFAGKSTLASKIAEKTGAKVIAFDKMWVEKEKDKTNKLKISWSFIRSEAKDKIRETLEKGVSVVYDDNNPKYQHRQEIMEIAQELDLEAFVIYLNTPIAL